MKTTQDDSVRLSVKHSFPKVQDRQGKAALKTHALQTLARMRVILSKSRSVWSARDLSPLLEWRGAGPRFGSVMLLSFAFAMTANLLLLHPLSAHAQGGVPLWT